MYQVGDRIVYPMHGAGVIEAIEEKTILGEKKDYYVVRIPLGNMKVLVPIDNCCEIGIRDVVCRDDADKVIDSFEIFDDEITNNWNKRYRENMEKLKSGNIFEIAGVVNSLMCRNREKGLSTGERKMLSSAKQILLSELVLATETDELSIERMINSRIDKIFELS
jgi:CarD family transcriptional regulator